MPASILSLPVLLVSFAGYGWIWLRLLRLERSAGPLRLLYAAALGMGTVAYAVLALGLLGALRVPILALLVGAGWVLALLWLRTPAVPEARPAPPPPQGPARWLRPLLLVFLALLCALTFVTALRPPDGSDWDSLAYHLAASKIYLREGRIPFIAYDSHTHFPFTMQMLYTLGLVTGNAAGAKLIHWAAGWLTAAGVGVLASRIRLRGAPPPVWTGPAAAAAFATAPVVQWEMGTAYVDLGTALFQFLALAALLDAVRLGEAGPLLDGRRVALAAALCGFAMGTKATALVQFGILGLALLLLTWRAGKTERPALLRAALGFGGIGLLVASPWYVKSWLWVHNPVYPFFFHLFPGSYSWTAEMARAYANEQARFGLGKGPVHLLRSLWDLGMHGRAFFINLPSMIGDKLGSIGPVWAGLIPLSLWVGRLPWQAAALLLYSLASLLAWFALSQQVRYLVPVLAPLAVAAALLPALAESRVLRGAMGTFLAAALLLGFGNAGPNGILIADLARQAWPVVTGEVSEAEYLDHALPGLHEAARFINTLPPGVRVALYSENRGYYLDRNYFWANPGHHNLIDYDRLPDSGSLAARLREFGITHVLINYDFSGDQEQARWYRLLMGMVQSGRLVEVFHSQGALFGRRGVMVYELR